MPSGRILGPLWAFVSKQVTIKVTLDVAVKINLANTLLAVAALAHLFV